MNRLLCRPCQDSPARAATWRANLSLPHSRAAALGQSAVIAADRGVYQDADGRLVDWQAAVNQARAAKRSLPPDAPLPAVDPPIGRRTGSAAGSATGGTTDSATGNRRFDATTVEVANETTLVAARRLHALAEPVLALNFANGVHPGGGFLDGALAQEEVLCRASALYATLAGDPMYAAHRQRPLPDATDWAILSPAVPVFRDDAGVALAAPWPLDILTCAAPYAPALGQPQAGDLLAQRIERVLAIAEAFGYTHLVLGAWGCGAFGNDPERTAWDFHAALTRRAGAFAEVVFAIADWSPDRRFLGPFCAALAA